MTPPVVHVVKKADDQITPTRVSLGAVIDGDRTLIGYYCVYRGTREAAIAALQSALAAMELLPGEPVIAPDDGKRFA